MAKRDSNYSKSNYSDEDKLAFEQRDRRITKLSCLERACDLAIARDRVDRVDNNVLDAVTTEITQLADKFVNWVYSDLKITDLKTIESKTTEPKQDKQYPVPYPVPSEQEKKVILEIVKQLHNINPRTPIHINTVIARIYGYYEKYPRELESIPKILKEVFNV